MKPKHIILIILGLLLLPNQNRTKVQSDIGQVINQWGQYCTIETKHNVYTTFATPACMLGSSVSIMIRDGEIVQIEPKH